MNSKAGLGHRLAAVAALAFVVAACGSTSTPTATSKGTVTVGGFAFTEGSVLAELYGQTRSPAMRPKLEKIIRVIIASQNPEGGWRYRPIARDADISVTVLQVVVVP